MASSKQSASTRDFTVAPGRTVRFEGNDVGPGGTVTLPDDEGARLQARGFFLTDDGAVSAPEGGPATEAGVEVTEQQ